MPFTGDSRTSVDAVRRSCVRVTGRTALPANPPFSLPMAGARIVLVRLSPDGSGSVRAVFITVTAVGGALTRYGLLVETPLGSLLVRPGWARLTPEQT